MKKIALVTSGKAYMPEIKAYKDFFSREYIVDIRSDNEELLSYDILWYFMGTKSRRKKRGQFVIHEYSSLSTPPFPKFKNFLKKMFLAKPDLRVFLNSNVKKEMNFNDDVPYCYRDMGVNTNSLTNEDIEVEFDIIYVGAIAGRKLDKAIDILLSYDEGIKICVVGLVGDDFKKKYSLNHNIKFVGKVAHELVAGYILKSKLCLNWIPNIYPYNIQTSTKFLEYAVLQKRIISNSYQWVNEFCKKNEIYYIDIEDYSLIKSHLSHCERQIYNFSPLSWQDVIKDSNISNFLPK
ncbi:hypothetical protein [Acinetobacter ursingii]|uniref:hypothetical protein n=1 Tax=Acinetobacter ursingii TaxID=108980 RepID=UPI00300B1786